MLNLILKKCVCSNKMAFLEIIYIGVKAKKISKTLLIKFAFQKKNAS